MYNQYQNGTDAWWAMKEAIDVHKDLEQQVDNVADTFESVIDQLDTAVNDREEMEEERDQLQRDFDDLQEKYDTLRTGVDLSHMIALITKLKLAAEAIDTYATNSLIYLGALNDVQEGDSNSSDGAAGDGGG